MSVTEHSLVFHCTLCVRVYCVQVPWWRRPRGAQEAEGPADRAPIHSICGKSAVPDSAGRHRHHLQRAEHSQRSTGQRQRDRQVQRSGSLMVE